MSGNVNRAKDTEAYITHRVRATLSNLAMVLLVVGNGHHLTFSSGPMAARVPNHGNILLKIWIEEETLVNITTMNITKFFKRNIFA